jgi:hypothetical protein
MRMQPNHQLRGLFGTAWHLVEKRPLHTILQESEGLTDEALDRYIRRNFPEADGPVYRDLRHALKVIPRQLPPTQGMLY